MARTLARGRGRVRTRTDGARSSYKPGVTGPKPAALTLHHLRRSVSSMPLTGQAGCRRAKSDVCRNALFRIKAPRKRGAPAALGLLAASGRHRPARRAAGWADGSLTRGLEPRGATDPTQPACVCLFFPLGRGDASGSVRPCRSRGWLVIAECRAIDCRVAARLAIGNEVQAGGGPASRGAAPGHRPRTTPDSRAHPQP
jgi:hypothetical protein